MKFYADLHIHSKYSRACSRDSDLEHLAWWAARKGIGVLGTGDFTHPAWIEELRTQLVPAEPGLFRLRPEVEQQVASQLPPACQTPVRFLLSSEISTIYKRDDRTRKVHHLLYAPDFDAVAEITRQLDRIGNLASDGRPILGLDSRNLLEITLGSGDGCYLVPAHVWTPWFAALGSQSGFDAIEDCYADLSDHIFALETGLSSDPEMNWRVSSLDRYRLVSNSDAHSPPMLAREATMFDTEPDYFSMLHALRTGEGFGGTVEFFPEEGKYHLDGHRACDVRTAPAATRDLGGRCPECGKPLTVGVLHRIETLADRAEGYRPDDPDQYRSLVPLPEIIGEIVGFGPKSKTVRERVSTLVGRLGPELAILDDLPLDEIARAGGSSLLVEALTRLRRGEVHREAGYDGVYGTIRLFSADELTRPKGVSTLFDLPMPAAEEPLPAGPQSTIDAAVPSPAADRDFTEPAPPPRRTTARGDLLGLDDDQRKVVEMADGPLLIVAGPGTGKTRVLTHLIAYRIRHRNFPPERCLAITFTRRASAELRERLAVVLPRQAGRVLVTTFHGLGLVLLREHFRELDLPPDLKVATDATRLALLQELQPASTGTVRRLATLIGEAKRSRASGRRTPLPLPSTDADRPELDGLLDRYDAELHGRGIVDLDDLIAMPLTLLETHQELAERCRDRWPELAVDEYQDVDELQYRLLRQLSRPDGNLSAIGDPDQAIYGFRGGDVGYFQHFTADFPTARVCQLTRNYRSSPTIVRGSLQAIRRTTLVPDRRLTSEQSLALDGPIIVHHADDEQGEAEAVAKMIEDSLGGASFVTLDRNEVERAPQHQRSFSDFAVLYRTKMQAQPIFDALARRGFPAQVRSHERLADRAEVQAIVELLSREPTDATTTVTDRVRAAIASLGDVADFDLTQTSELLVRLANECDENMERFLTELALGVEVDLWDPRADRVSLLTMHASKGLEFPVVFLVGCEDGLLPLRRWQGVRSENNTDRTDDPDEERRLFFVGMTRATTQLVLTMAGHRQRSGAVQDCSPSPFLADIDTSLLDERHVVATGRTRPAHRQLRLL